MEWGRQRMEWGGKRMNGGGKWNREWNGGGGKNGMGDRVQSAQLNIIQERGLHVFVFSPTHSSL